MSALQYMALSALAGKDLPQGDNPDTNSPWTIAELIAKNKIDEYRDQNGSINSEFSSLASIGSYTLVSFQPNTSSGFAGAAFKNPTTGEIIFSFRGTETGNLVEQIKDVTTDAQIAIAGLAANGPNQFYDTRDFIHQTVEKLAGNNNMTKADVKLYLEAANVSYTGHSLGGGISQYAVLEFGGEATTFNAVGIGQFLPSNTNTFQFDITDYANEHDIIGNYGVQLGVTKYIKDSNASSHFGNNLAALGGPIGLLLTGGGALVGSHGMEKMLHKGIGGAHTLNMEVSGMTADTKMLTIALYGLSQAVTYTGGELHAGFYRVGAASIGAFKTARANATYKVYMFAYGVYYVGDTLEGWAEDGVDLTKDAASSYLKMGRNILSWVFGGVQDHFTKAAGIPPTPRDPLILDLNGDGIKTTDLTGSTAHFDLDANGFAERVGWVSANDGLLVLDRNGNGKIDDGTELFGDRTLLQDGTLATSGFEALAEFDSNQDGVIDENDAIYSQLRVWRDVNGDGVSTLSEFATLRELNIVAINLDSVVTNVTDVMNNIQRRLGSFVRSDAQGNHITGDIGEYLLRRDTSNTLEIGGSTTAHTVDTGEIDFLPYLAGSGDVASLRSAMYADTSGVLQSLVEDFISETDIATRYALLDEILYKWTGNDAVNQYSRGGFIDARQLGVLEEFLGTEFMGGDGSSPNQNAAPILKEAYGDLKEKVYIALLAQTHIASVLELVAWSTLPNGEIVLDLDAVASAIDQALVVDHSNGVALLSEFARSMKEQGFSTDSGFGVFRQYFASQSAEYLRTIELAGTKSLAGTNGNDTLVGSARIHTIMGGDGNDSISAQNINHDVRLYGEAGDDTLTAWGGNDTLVGGAGDDYLSGGTGDDTYVFALGDGQDTIYDGGGVDTIQFGVGIAASDLRFERVVSGRNYNLEISIVGTTDKITVLQYFGYGYDDWQQQAGYESFLHNRIEKIIFADGSELSSLDITRTVKTIKGTSGNDVLTPWQQDRWGKEWQSEMGFILDGGAGADILEGGGGADIFVFGRGYGIDTIRPYGTDGADSVRFKVDILPEDIVITRNGVSLELAIAGTQDKLILQDYLNYRDSIGKFEFTNGTIWTRQDVINQFLHLAGTDGDDILNGAYGIDELIEGGDGNDTINAYGGGDTVNPGSGDDHVSATGATLTYMFDLGDGKDFLAAGVNNIKVQFGSSIAPTNVVTYRRANGGVIFEIVDGVGVPTGDRLEIQGYTKPEVHFSDATVWSQNYVSALVDTQTQAYVFGSDGDDGMLYGGPYGSNIIKAGAGNDTIMAFANDKIYSDSGNDTYRIGRNGSTVEIYDNGTTSDVDTILLDYGLQLSDIAIYNLPGEQAGIRIEIRGYSPNDPTGSVLYYSDRVPKITFSTDNSTMSQADVAAAIIPVIEGTSGDDVLTGTSNSDFIYGGAGNDLLQGGVGNDRLYGEAGNDALFGGTGDDILYGGTGDNILDGGAGNDTLYGEAGGNNVFKFGRGYGMDTVKFTGTAQNPSGTAKVLLGADIVPQDVQIVTYAAGGFYIMLKDETGYTGEYLKVEGGLDESIHGPISIEFANSTIWTKADIEYQATRVVGTAGDDQLVGFSDANETIEGGAGDDKLYAYGGHDTLNPGQGDDYVSGYSGSATYLYNVGDGQDTLDASLLDGVDIVLGTGIEPGNVVLKRLANDAGRVLEFVDANGNETGDRVVIRSGTEPTVHFADNTVWTYADILAASTSLATTYEYGTKWDNIIYGDATENTIYAGAGNDTVEAGAGNDVIYSSAGNDTYKFKRGDGNDIIHDTGSTTDLDVIQFGQGITTSDIIIYELTGSQAGVRVEVKGMYGMPSTDSVTYYSGRMPELHFADSTIMTQADVQAVAIAVLEGTNGNDILYGTSAGDVIYGGAGDDEIYGEGGNDSLYGGTGTNILDGGAGDDILYGEAGGDNIFRFGRGYGFDTIRFTSSAQNPSGTATIAFGAGITAQDIIMAADGNGTGFYIGIEDNGQYPDILWVTGAFDQSNHGEVSIQFADNTVWTSADIWSKVYPTVGTEGSDTLLGNMYSAYDDTLVGYGGDDILAGYAGNDTLYGGLGNDMYGAFYGEGSDTILDDGGNDTIMSFAPWISIIFERVGDDLHGTSIDNPNYLLTVTDHYATSGETRIETMQDMTGMTISHTHIDQLIQAMATFSANSNGMTWAQALQSNQQDVQTIASQYWAAPTT